MARRRSEDQGDTSGEILSAAFRLFGRYGYDGVSMSQVAVKAGVKKASLYYHFASKEELYAECHRRLHRLFEELVFDQARKSTGALARFQALFSGVQALIQHPALEDGIAGYWLAPSTAELGAVLDAQQRFTEACVSEIATLMREGIDAGELHYDGDVVAMSRAVLAVIEVLALPLQGSDPDEVRSVVDHLGGTFIRAYLLS